MQLNPIEMSDVIKKRIEDFKSTTQTRTEGRIVTLADGIATVYGLQNVMHRRNG